MQDEENSEKEDFSKKLEELKQDIELLDEKILFLFGRVKTLSEKIDYLFHIFQVPTYQPSQVSVTKRQAVTHVAPSKVRSEPIIEAKQEEPPVQVKASTAEKVKKISVSTKRLFKREDIFPYFMLLAFYLLLSASIYLTTIILINELQEEFFTPQNVFIMILSASILFVGISFFVKRYLERRNKSKYFVFPYSFLGVGTAGIFISYIIAMSQEGIAEQSIVLWSIGITVQLIPMFLAIKFKNELLSGESFLFLILYGMLPVFSQFEVIGDNSSYFYAGLFMIFIGASYALAKFKLTAAPSIISLLAFPIFCFIPSVYSFLTFDSLLVIIPATLVALLFLENVYLEFREYENTVMQTVLLLILALLPLSTYIFLVFSRDIAQISSWEILLSSIFLTATYFLIDRYVFDQSQENQITNPNFIRNVITLLVCVEVVVAFISESLFIEASVYLTLYVLLQTAISIQIIRKRSLSKASMFLNIFLSLASLEILFVILFSPLPNVSETSKFWIDIALSCGIAATFLFSLIEIAIFKNSQHRTIANSLMVFLGAINLFVMNFHSSGSSLSRIIAEFVIIVVSIGYGIYNILIKKGIISFSQFERPKISLNLYHAFSILALTSSMWFMDKEDGVIYYIIFSGILLSMFIWIVNLALTKETEGKKIDELFGTIAISVGFISVPAGIVYHSEGLSIYVTLSIAILIAASVLLSKTYNVLYPVFIYAIQLIAIWAFPGIETLFGADWLIPVTYILPTFALLYASIRHKSWITRLTTTILASLMLVITSLVLKGTTGYSILISINSLVIVIYPLIIYSLFIWWKKEEEKKRVMFEYPINIFFTTIGAIIANTFVQKTELSNIFVFVFLLLGSIVGPLLYMLNEFLKKHPSVRPKLRRYNHLSYITIIHALFLIAGATSVLSASYFIAYMCVTTVITLFLTYYLKFDSLFFIPPLISTMFIPVFSYSLTGWYTFSILSIYLLFSSIRWINSLQPFATGVVYSLIGLIFIFSSFIGVMNQFKNIPEYFAFIAIAIMLLSSSIPLIKIRVKPNNSLVSFILCVWAVIITITGLNIAIQQEFVFSDTATFLQYLIPALVLIIIYELIGAYIQYKTNPSNTNLVFQFLAATTLLITQGSIFSFGFAYYSSIAEIMAYFTFCIFGILGYFVAESFVIEYTLIQTDTKGAGPLQLGLIVPLFVFCQVITLYKQYSSIILFVLAFTFVAMSLRHKLKLNTAIGFVFLVESTFFISLPAKLMSSISFSVSTSLFTVMFILGILFYLKRNNRFILIWVTSIILLAEAINGFLYIPQLSWAFGFAFNLALVGVIVGSFFEIKELQILFSVAAGILLLPYFFFVFTEQPPSYLSLLLLLSGIALSIIAYVIYLRQREQKLIKDL
ncbi:MAG: hypothetical protein ACTSYD_11470 [Candidatus Heimdallarchaeaceae archaeon]